MLEHIGGQGVEMMEVSTSIKTEEEEDENELSLELSIGRKCYNTTTTPILPQKSIDLAHEQTKCNMITSTFPTSQLHPLIDLPFKREIQALRRQEARRKRDQKLKFKSTLSSRGGGGGRNENVCCVINYEDHALVEDEEDDDEEAEMPPRKKEKSLSFSNTNNHNNVVSIVGPEEEEEQQQQQQQQQQDEEEKLLVRDLNLKINRESGLMGESPYPTLPAIQYVPFTNGFVYHPHGLLPSCLGSSLVTCSNGFIDKDKGVSFGNGTGGNEGPEKDPRRVSFGTAACRSFRPYSRNLDMNVVNAKTDASSGGSSPAVSDHHNSSLQGSSSSINFPRESRNAFSAGNGPKRFEIKCWDSTGMGSKEVKNKTKANHTVNMTLSTNIQVRESLRCSEEPKPAGPLKDPALSTKNPIGPVLLKNETRNAVIANTLKTQLKCNGASPLPQMPCVSTTGNGPSGKTITGFLYRYTKTEVCIVCVCHGTLFSPAEFVKHAGGVDVEHPLRHITIVPSDLA